MCERFNDERILMFRETRLFHPLSVNYLLFGKPSISNEENFLLFQAVQRYIKIQKGLHKPIIHNGVCNGTNDRMVVRSSPLSSTYVSFFQFFCLSFFLFFTGILLTYTMFWGTHCMQHVVSASTL